MSPFEAASSTRRKVFKNPDAVLSACRPSRSFPSAHSQRGWRRRCPESPSSSSARQKASAVITSVAWHGMVAELMLRASPPRTLLRHLRAAVGLPEAHADPALHLLALNEACQTLAESGAFLLPASTWSIGRTERLLRLHDRLAEEALEQAAWDDDPGLGPFAEAIAQVEAASGRLHPALVTRHVTEALEKRDPTTRRSCCERGRSPPPPRSTRSRRFRRGLVCRRRALC